MFQQEGLAKEWKPRWLTKEDKPKTANQRWLTREVSDKRFRIFFYKKSGTKKRYKDGKEI